MAICVRLSRLLPNKHFSCGRNRASSPLPERDEMLMNWSNHLQTTWKSIRSLWRRSFWCSWFSHERQWTELILLSIMKRRERGAYAPIQTPLWWHVDNAAYGGQAGCCCCCCCCCSCSCSCSCWLLVVGCWLLVVGCCLLFVVCCLLFVGCWLLVVGCWLLVVGCWLLVVGCCLLFVGCWLLFVGCWLLVVGCWLLRSSGRLSWHGCPRAEPDKRQLRNVLHSMPLLLRTRALLGLMLLAASWS